MSTTHRAMSVTTLAAFAVLTAGCSIERLFAEQVGAGVGRLSARNAAMLAKLVDDDVRCGYSSPAVKNGYVVEGEVGSVGQVTWRVDGCVIDFGDLGVEGRDCNGVERSIGGKATVTGSRTVRGVITGNPETPVIPLTNDAVHVQYEADVLDWEVRFSDANNAAIMKRAHIRFDAEVHLAQSESLGVCGIDTGEVTLRSVRVSDGLYTIDNDGHVFDVDVPAVAITAQIGQWGDKENYIDGHVTVWDQDVDLSFDHVLDPAYDRETYRASYACKEDLKVPQSYECPDLGEAVSDGAARLLLNDIGNLVQAAVADTRCGFASPSVLENARITGEVGTSGGEAVFAIETPCVIDVPADTFLSRNCLGTATLASGKATLRGTMRQRGRLTGDPRQPVIPESRDAVEIAFDVDFMGWSVATTTTGTMEGAQQLVVSTGGVTGRMMPRLAKDAATGACSVPTPVVRFEDVVVKPGTSGVLHNGGMAMAVTIHEGALDAQVGDRDGDVNRLTGSLTVDVLGDEGRVVDVSGDLDPAYDAGAAYASFSCTPNLVLPQSDAECDFDAVLAENAARLTIQTAGTLASMINKDDTCGFEDTFGVLLWPTDVQGDNGEMGSMTWDVADCAIDTPSPEIVSEDCVGGVTYVEGDAEFVDVGRTVRGERDKMVLDFVIDSIIPRQSDAVDVFLREVRLRDFATYAVAAGADEPAGVLFIHEGTLSATVQPALGARADDRSIVDVPTPVARLSSVRLTAEASLYAQGKVFHFRIDDSDLTATNGAFMGEENALSGTISIDGTARALGALALNPTYDAAVFDESYACTENLAAPL